MITQKHFIVSFIFISISIFVLETITNNRIFWTIYSLVLVVYCVIALLYLTYGFIVREILPIFSIHLSRPYRSIHEDEKNILTTYILEKGSAQRTFVDPHITYIQWALIPLAIIMYTLMFSGVFLGLGLGINLYFQLFSAGFFMALILYPNIYLIYQKNHSYKDLTHPVYLIQDTVRENFNTADNKKYDFKIGKYGFFFDAIHPDYAKEAHRLSKDDSVTIEFSPVTHFVWRIEKMR